MAAQILHDGCPDGVQVCRATTEKFAVFGTPTVSQQAALTAQLTTLNPADAEGTPDYDIQAITASSPYGFKTAQEGITTLYVIKNLQTRLAQVEDRLEKIGIIAAN